MKTDTSKYGLESLIVKHMTSTGWNASAPSDYDRAYAVDLTQFCEFVNATQEPLIEAFDLDNEGLSRRKFLARLQGEITKRGTIDVLRNIPWADGDRDHKLITEDIPAKVDADPAYQNAKKQGDKSKARIEHDAALQRVILGLLNDDTELFKQWSDNAGFKRWLADTVFGITYNGGTV